jgi:hypothetical protein
VGPKNVILNGSISTAFRRMGRKWKDNGIAKIAERTVKKEELGDTII